MNTLESLHVVPLGGPGGAEVQGIDLAKPVPEAVAAALRQTWYRHLVLLFRGQALSDDQLIAAAGIFGGAQAGGAHDYFVKAGAGSNPHQAGRPEITVISNLDERGRPVKENAGLGSLEVVWHSDNSYLPVPPAGSMLYSLEIPEGGGGDTWFNNQYLAYETLADDVKRRIEGLVQVHDSSRNSAGVLRPGVKLPTCPEEVQGPRHPLVRVHPGTGRPALYLGRRREWPSNYIVGVSNADSEALLDILWAHATKPEFAWMHRWRKGDCVLWDNRAAMHYRSEVDPTRARVMHRTQIKGEAIIPFAQSRAAE